MASQEVEIVDLGTALPLGQAAELLGTTPEDVWRLAQAREVHGLTLDGHRVVIEESVYRYRDKPQEA